MNKWLIGLLALVALIVVSAYFLIPSTLKVSSICVLNANENGTLRFLSNEKEWSRWWDYKDDKTPQPQSAVKPFVCAGNKFELAENLYKSVKIRIGNNERNIESMINLFPINKDSVALQWEYSCTLSSNPVTRIIDYFSARKTKKCMKEILDHFKTFIEKKENVYGISFDRTSFKDSLLISTKAVSINYPTTAFIYELVTVLQKHAEAKGASQTNAPIYNITRVDSVYTLMVALPVNKALESDAKFAFKKMVAGSFIVANVTGGEYSVNNALNNIHQYFLDYQKTAMAINFQMLVTDRRTEPDSAKWITRVYQPVY